MDCVSNVINSVTATLRSYKELLTVLLFVGWFVRRTAQELLNRFSEVVENQFSGPEKTQLKFYADLDKETDTGTFSHTLSPF